MQKKLKISFTKRGKKLCVDRIVLFQWALRCYPHDEEKL